MSEVMINAVGRRKKAIARVRLIPGEGNITMSNKTVSSIEILDIIDINLASVEEARELEKEMIKVRDREDAQRKITE